MKFRIINILEKYKRNKNKFLNKIIVLISIVFSQIKIKPIKSQVLIISNPNLNQDTNTTNTSIIIENKNSNLFDNKCTLTGYEPKKVILNYSKILKN
jgi:hypothetical protein